MYISVSDPEVICGSVSAVNNSTVVDDSFHVLLKFSP